MDGFMKQKLKAETRGGGMTRNVNEKAVFVSRKRLFDIFARRSSETFESSVISIERAETRFLISISLHFLSFP